MRALLSRRSFLRASVTAAGGMLINVGFSGRAFAFDAVEQGPWVFVRIEPGQPVVIGARATEIGQGVKTSLPMLIAEELDVGWDQVVVEQLPYKLVASENERGFRGKYGSQGAGGSTSIPASYEELRQVGAKIRHTLVQAAARAWKVDAGLLNTERGRVLHPDGRYLTYQQLSTQAAVLPIPDDPVPMKIPDEFKVIGKRTGVADCRDIVTGQAEFGIDADIDGALVAVIARCPYFEGDIDTLDDSAALDVDGVRHVVRIPPPDSAKGLGTHLAAGVAVVANDTWSAIKGRDALNVTWKMGRWGGDSSAALERRVQQALHVKRHVARSDGNFARAVESASRVVRADYHMPFLAHATMEPQSALIHLQQDRALLIASMQSPGSASQMIHEMTGIDRLNIDIRIPRAGGGFGRRLENDFVGEAVHVAKVVKRPVKVVWTREDDMQHDWFRPSGTHRMTATINAANEVDGWSHCVAATDRRFGLPRYDSADPWLACLDPDAFPAGCVENYEAAYTPVECGLARGWWRGPLPSFTAFAIQSFIDELAHANGEDPLAMRLRLLGEPRDMDYRDHGGPTFNTGRLATVLTRAANEIGYGRELPQGRGIGIAAHFVFGGYTAHAMEVSVEDGGLKIARCVCATDVGQVVNPLGVEAQMMGATIDGISTALNLQITIKDGRVEQKNFPDYPLMRMVDAPDVEVRIIDSHEVPSGAGEMGMPTVAPALANAIFAATGKRIRRLPIADQLNS